jgi:molybdopterin-guanine dinucleotide biosynthesis protein A
MQITGIILAGGKSLRMGTDKALVEINGKTLLQRAIDLCRPFCHDILISTNQPGHTGLGYLTVPDEIKGCGPLGGIYSCLKKSKTDWNFVLSVDAAFVEPGFLCFLTSEKEGFDVVVPKHKNGVEPLIALYHKNCLPAITKQLEEGKYKMQDLLKQVNTHFLESQFWAEKYPRIFFNLNRPDDIPETGRRVL